MGNSRKAAVAAMATATVALGAAGTAQAGTFICVPPQAGVAVVSGGPNGTCDSVSTPVALPTAAADQQKLLSILPYIQFKAAGMGGKPTIVVKGANLQLRRGDESTLNDGTGNLQVGSGVNDAYAGHSGTENLLVGHDNKWTGNGNVVSGAFHDVSGSGNVVAGTQHTVPGNSNVVTGAGNTVSGSQNYLLGAFNKQAAGQRAILADGAPVSQSHWAKYDANGTLLASSEPLEYSYGNSSYAMLKFKGVDLTKCAVTVQSAGGKAADTTWSIWYDSYIYARSDNGSGNWVANIPYDIVATCDK
jgi:hypothetical protein